MRGHAIIPTTIPTSTAGAGPGAETRALLDTNSSEAVGLHSAANSVVAPPERGSQQPDHQHWAHVGVLGSGWAAASCWCQDALTTLRDKVQALMQGLLVRLGRLTPPGKLSAMSLATPEVIPPLVEGSGGNTQPPPFALKALEILHGSPAGKSSSAVASPGSAAAEPEDADQLNEDLIFLVAVAAAVGESGANHVTSEPIPDSSRQCSIAHDPMESAVPPPIHPLLQAVLAVGLLLALLPILLASQILLVGSTVAAAAQSSFLPQQQAWTDLVYPAGCIALMLVAAGGTACKVMMDIQFRQRIKREQARILAALVQERKEHRVATHQLRGTLDAERRQCSDALRQQEELEVKLEAERKMHSAAADQQQQLAELGQALKLQAELQMQALAEHQASEAGEIRQLLDSSHREGQVQAQQLQQLVGTLHSDGLSAASQQLLAVQETVQSAQLAHSSEVCEVRQQVSELLAAQSEEMKQLVTAVAKAFQQVLRGPSAELREARALRSQESQKGLQQLEVLRGPSAELRGAEALREAEAQKGLQQLGMEQQSDGRLQAEASQRQLGMASLSQVGMKAGLETMLQQHLEAQKQQLEQALSDSAQQQLGVQRQHLVQALRESVQPPNGKADHLAQQLLHMEGEVLAALQLQAGDLSELRGLVKTMEEERLMRAQDVAQAQAGDITGLRGLVETMGEEQREERLRVQGIALLHTGHLLELRRVAETTEEELLAERRRVQDVAVVQAGEISKLSRLVETMGEEQREERQRAQDIALAHTGHLLELRRISETVGEELLAERRRVQDAAVVQAEEISKLSRLIETAGEEQREEWLADRLRAQDIALVQAEAAAETAAEIALQRSSVRAGQGQGMGGRGSDRGSSAGDTAEILGKDGSRAGGGGMGWAQSLGKGVGVEAKICTCSGHPGPSTGCLNPTHFSACDRTGISHFSLLVTAAL